MIILHDNPFAVFSRAGGGGSGGSQADPPLSVGTLVCYGIDGLPEAGVSVHFQQRVGTGSAGNAWDSTIFTQTSAVTTGIVSYSFIRLATYRHRRGVDGDWSDPWVVPDSGSFSINEIIGSP